MHMMGSKLSNLVLIHGLAAGGFLVDAAINPSGLAVPTIYRHATATAGTQTLYNYDAQCSCDPTYAALGAATNNGPIYVYNSGSSIPSGGTGTNKPGVGAANQADGSGAGGVGSLYTTTQTTVVQYLKTVLQVSYTTSTILAGAGVAPQMTAVPVIQTITNTVTTTQTLTSVATATQPAAVITLGPYSNTSSSANDGGASVKDGGRSLSSTTSMISLALSVPTTTSPVQTKSSSTSNLLSPAGTTTTSDSSIMFYTPSASSTDATTSATSLFTTSPVSSGSSTSSSAETFMTFSTSTTQFTSSSSSQSISTSSSSSSQFVPSSSSSSSAVSTTTAATPVSPPTPTDGCTNLSNPYTAVDGENFQLYCTIESISFSDTYTTTPTSSFQACVEACSTTAACQSVGYVSGECLLSSEPATFYQSSNVNDGFFGANLIQP